MKASSLVVVVSAMKITKDLVKSFNAAFISLLNKDIHSFKRIINAAPKDVANVQLRPSDLPNYLTIIGMDRFSLMHIVAYFGLIDALKVLIKKGGEWNALDETFGGSCLHWAVFGLKKEMGVYLFFDLNCDIYVRNKYGQTPLDLFALKKEIWEFLNPSSFNLAKGIGHFLRLIDLPVAKRTLSTSTKYYIVLLNLASFSKIMDSIKLGRYLKIQPSTGFELFFNDLRSLFQEGLLFYQEDKEKKKILKTFKDLLKKDLFKLEPSVSKQSIKPLVPVNFLCKPDSKIESLSSLYSIIEYIRIDAIGLDQGYMIKESNGKDPVCFNFSIPSDRSDIPISLKIKFFHTSRSFLPTLFANSHRIQTFTVDYRIYEWNFPLKAGLTSLDSLFSIAKETDGRRKYDKNGNLHTTGEIFHAFTHFLYCSNPLL